MGKGIVPDSVFQTVAMFMGYLVFSYEHVKTRSLGFLLKSLDEVVNLSAIPQGIGQLITHVLEGNCRDSPL